MISFADEDFKELVYIHAQLWEIQKEFPLNDGSPLDMERKERSQIAQRLYRLLEKTGRVSPNPCDPFGMAYSLSGVHNPYHPDLWSEQCLKDK